MYSINSQHEDIVKRKEVTSIKSDTAFVVLLETEDENKKPITKIMEVVD